MTSPLKGPDLKGTDRRVALHSSSGLAHGRPLLSHKNHKLTHLNNIGTLRQ